MSNTFGKNKMKMWQAILWAILHLVVYLTKILYSLPKVLYKTVHGNINLNSPELQTCHVFQEDNQQTTCINTFYGKYTPMRMKHCTQL
jgi:hypothetical protein